MVKLNLRLALTFSWIFVGALLLAPCFTKAQTTNVIVVDGNPIISTGTTMLIEGNMILMSNSTIDNSGNIALTGNWQNNAGSPGLVNQSPGTVTLFGDTQYIEGTYSTDFYNLSLAGTGLKLISNDTKVYDSLELSDRQLSTQAHTLTVESTNAGIVTNNNGYVRSDAGGTFVRKMAGTADYLFPVGSNTETKYRPLSLQNTAAAAQTFSVNMVDKDPSTDGYDRTQTDGSMCNINAGFYHVINRTAGSTSVNLSLFYDSAADGSFHKIAHWKTTSLWETTGNYSYPNLGSLLGVTSAGWNNFNSPVFALADRYAQPIVTPSGHVNVCHSQSVVLSANNGYVSYHWNTGETTQSITVSTPGDYFVTGNLGNGSDCIAISDTVHVTVQSQVSPVITAQSATTFCDGGSVTLSANSGYDSYLWSTGETTPSITVDTTGTFNVTATLTGCSGAATTTSVTVKPLPAIGVASSNSTVCNGSDIDLFANSVPNASYTWNGPNGYTSSLQNPVISSSSLADSGYYTLVITVNGCNSPAADSTFVAIAAHTPLPFISHNGATLSSGQSSPATNQWYYNGVEINGATNETYVAPHSGWYKVAVDFPGLCPTFSDSVYILLTSVPTVSLDANVKVLPNPFNSQFMLEISNDVSELNKWSVSITDVLGREVYQSSSLQYSNTVDLGNQASGVYFVTVNSSTERKTFRMVKQQ